MSRTKILGIGNALVDIIALLNDDQIINKLSLPKGAMTLVDGTLSAKIQSEISNQKIKIATGGSVANAINGIANLGVECGFMGTIGRDDLGKHFENDIKENGIEHLLKIIDQPTGRAVGLVSPNGERTFATYLGAAVEMSPIDLKEEKLSQFHIFFIEGYLVINNELIVAAVKMAKAAGMIIALDLASYNVVEANIDLLNELVDNYVDIIFANEDEARAFTGLEPEKALDNISARCNIAIVKVGSDGAFIKQGTAKHHIPAFSKKVIDTTGAGDFFAAGFLAGIAKGYSLEKCGKLGALLAGKIINTMGAKLEKEEWSEIKKLEIEL